MVAREGNIPFIAKSPDEFFGRVDAVMVIYRDGKYHLDHILPFIQRGYPVWMDKPVVASVEDVRRLCAAVKEHNALITGGSTMKYNTQIRELKDKVDSGSLGRVTGGFMNFPANLKSEYSGLYFYASHLCEMCLTVFGYNADSVQACVTDDSNMSVVVYYDNKPVVLHFDESVSQYYGLVMGSHGSAMTQFDLSIIYKLGFEQFIKMLREKTMPLSLEDLVKPVYMIDAILRSISEGRKVHIMENN